MVHNAKMLTHAAGIRIFCQCSVHRATTSAEFFAQLALICSFVIVRWERWVERGGRATCIANNALDPTMNTAQATCSFFNAYMRSNVIWFGENDIGSQWRMKAVMTNCRLWAISMLWAHAGCVNVSSRLTRINYVMTFVNSNLTKGFTTDLEIFRTLSDFMRFRQFFSDLAGLSHTL